MLIWISILLIFGLLAVLGFYQGAVRFLVSLVGMVAAVVLALPATIITGFIVKLLGVQSMMWSVALPLILSFAVIYLIGLGIAQLVHRKVEHYYKYKAEDVTRIRWERLNRRLGIPLGLATGAAWILMLGLGVYIAGYPTVQLSVDGNATGAYRWVNMARQGLHSSGLDKTVSRFDPMPGNYYQISDLLGLLYQNPILRSRLAAYPPFLRAAENPVLAEFASDQEFMELLLSKGDIATIVANPRTQALLAAGALYMAETKPDLKDLQTYLETGKSARYDHEKILGRWRINTYATVAQARRKNPDMSGSEMRVLRRSVPALASLRFLATTDEKISLTVQSAQPPPAPAGEAAVAVEVAPAVVPPPPGRGGRGGRGGAGGGRGGAAAQNDPAGPTWNVRPSEGTWKNALDRYELGLGNSGKVEAVIEGNRLFIHHPQGTLVFDKGA